MFCVSSLAREQNADALYQVQVDGPATSVMVYEGKQPIFVDGKEVDPKRETFKCARS